jgi:hypothetical protein
VKNSRLQESSGTNPLPVSAALAISTYRTLTQPGSGCIWNDLWIRRSKGQSPRRGLEAGHRNIQMEDCRVQCAPDPRNLDLSCSAENLDMVPKRLPASRQSRLSNLLVAFDSLQVLRNELADTCLVSVSSCLDTVMDTKAAMIERGYREMRNTGSRANILRSPMLATNTVWVRYRFSTVSDAELRRTRQILGTCETGSQLLIFWAAKQALERARESLVGLRLWP